VSGIKVKTLLITSLVCLFWIGCISLTKTEKQELTKSTYEEKQHENEQPEQLISNQARDVSIDKDNIWFATDKGISRYDRIKKKWTVYTVQHGLVSNDIRAVAIDGEDVWFGTDNGISVYNYKKDKWKTYKEQDGLVDDSVLCIKIDGRYVWIGTEGGLSRYDKEIDSWATHQENSGDRYFGLVFSFGRAIRFRDRVPVTVIALDGNYVWIGTYRGVLRYDKDKDSWSKYTKSDGLVSNEISAIAVDDDSVWFGTIDAGVSRYSKTEQAFVKSYTKRDLLASNRINSITVDGNYVWFAFANGGVQQYVRSVDTWRAFTKDDVLPSNHITTIASYGQEVWMGTYEDGIVRYDKRTDEWDSYKETENLIDNDINQLAVNEEQLWVATPSGLSRFDYHKQEWKNYKKADGLITNYVTCLELGDTDQVWVGTSRGLGALQKVKSEQNVWRFYSKEDGLLDDFITSINLIQKKIYVGTKKGLSRAEIKDGQLNFNTIFNSDDLENEYLDFSVNNVDKQEEMLWVATSRGLVKYNLSNQEFKIFNKDDGLPSNFINTVKVWYGRVWIGTHAGLYVIKQEQSLDVEFVEPLIECLQKKNVRDFKIGDQAIWAATPQGVVRYDLTTGDITDYTFENSNGNLAHNNVKSIALTGSEVWFGTCAGVSRLDKRYGLKSQNDIRLIQKAWTKYKALNSVDVLHLDYVARFVNDDAYIWFGNWANTKNGAIGRYDKQTNTWNFFTRKNLPLKSDGNPITRVRWITASSDDVWFGTNGGLLRYDKYLDTWQHYNSSDGLPNDDIHYVLVDKMPQDSKMPEHQLVWLVHAGNVISRYDLDKDEWTSYEIGESTGWDSGVTIDADERYVWFPTGTDGLRRYDKIADEWEAIRKSDGLGSNSTLHVLVDGNYVWVTSRRNVSRYDLTTNQWKVFHEYTVIHQDPMWMDKGIDGVWILYAPWREFPGTKYNYKSDSWYSIKSSEGHGAGASKVVETEKNLWFATRWRDLHRYNKASKTWTIYELGDGFGRLEINDRSLLVDGGKVWIGTYEGLFVYDIEKDNWTHYKNADPKLPSSRITALTVDEEYLWCATSKGLGRYDKKKGHWKIFRAPDWGYGGPHEGAKRYWKGLISNIINSLAIGENYLWVGTKYGVSRYDFEADQWENYFSNNGLPDEEIRDLTISGYDVWAATANGVSQYNRLSDDENAWRTYTSMSEIKSSDESKEYVESLVHNDVRCLAADHKYVWFGTAKGVSRYIKDKARWETFELPYFEQVSNSNNKARIQLVSSFENSKKSRYKVISCIETDGQIIWFGTARGLIRYNLKTGNFRKYTKDDGLVSNWITCIEEDEKEIWIGSTSNGISVFNKENQEWKNYNTKNSLLPHNQIHAIQIDGNFVWIGTENGLIRYSRQKDEWTIFESE